MEFGSPESLEKLASDYPLNGEIFGGVVCPARNTMPVRDVWMRNRILDFMSCQCRVVGFERALTYFKVTYDKVEWRLSGK